MRDRELCLDFLENCFDVRNNRRFVLRLLDCLAGDKNNDVRWHAFVLVGDFVEEHPEKVWPIVLRYGSHPSYDMRGAVACCLLEHLLEHHFHQYFPKVKRILLRGDKRFAYTLSRCYFLGQAKVHEVEIGSLIKAARKRRR